MTVKIGEMTAEFSNSSIAYVAIGMDVNDISSNVQSRLVNLSVNGNSRFSIVKDGKLTINANVSSSNIILQVSNNNSEIIKVTPNVAKVNTTAHIRSYAEEYKLLTGTNLVLNLGQASVFGATNITSISFVKPVTHETSTESYSCSLVLFNAGSVANSVWSSADIVWPNGTLPLDMNNRPAVLTFLNINNSDTWYGIVSGKDYI